MAGGRRRNASTAFVPRQRTPSQRAATTVLQRVNFDYGASHGPCPKVCSGGRFIMVGQRDA